MINLGKVKFKGAVVQSLDKSTDKNFQMHRICIEFIHWIRIFPVNSAMQALYSNPKGDDHLTVFYHDQSQGGLQP